MTVTEQREASLALAQAKRLELAAIKRDLRSGTTSLAALMEDPPEALHSSLLIDVLRWTRSTARNGRGITEIGRQALRDNVNLMIALGDASARSRAWAAEWGRYGRPGL